jgi:hypothetical protein
MSPTRRLEGIAALSAAALATTGLAGAALAADQDETDDCAFPDVCMDTGMEGSLGGAMDTEFMRQMLKAQGLPDESIDQVLAFYASMLGGGDGATPDMAALMAAFGGGDLPDDVLAKVEASYAELGLDPGALFPKVEDPADPEAMLKMGDTELADSMMKVTFDELGSDPSALFEKITPYLEPGVALGLAEDALAQAAAEGDIDEATLQAILDLLPDE